ncbi:MAG: CvpA family protein [Rhodobacteraceae bacterium]|nr:MAG: CvpA family protein [Paracoccaceae bacterium]
MEGFNLVDAAVAVVILASAILAYSRGFIRESLAIAGWVAAAVLAFVFAPTVQPLIREVPYVGNFIGDSCELSMIAAFAVVFAVVLVIASLFTPLFSSFVRNTALDGIDTGAGFLFGIARGFLLVAIALMVFERAVPPGTVPMVAESRSASIFGQFSGNLDEAVPQDAPNWLVGKYEELVGSCR